MQQRKSPGKAKRSQLGKKNTSFKAVSKSAKGKHRTQNQAGAKKHFAKKTAKKTTTKVTAQPTPRRVEPAVQRHGVRYVTIEDNANGQRIDNYLRRLLPNLPTSRLYQMLRKGEVRINKKRVKPESRLATGDILRLPPTTIVEKTGTYVPEKALLAIQQAVLYQDEHFMVLNKPAGLAVHAGSKNQYGVIDAVRQAFPDENWELCHRLDKDTSGCLVLGNSRAALNTFQSVKHISAVVDGR